MSEFPKRILFVASRSDIAGGEVYLLNVMRYLDRNRFQPLVTVPREGSFSQALSHEGVESAVIEADYGWLRPPAVWYQFVKGFEDRVRRFRGLIEERGIDLVHTNSNKILEGALAARLQGVHHVYLAHIEFQPNMPIFERFPIDAASFARVMGDLSSRVIAVSRGVASALVPPLAPEQVRVIHNGLDFQVYDRLAQSTNGGLRAELGLPADALLIASVGRIHPDKGNDILVRCAAEVAGQAENKRVHFFHAGEDDDKAFADQTRALVKDLELENQFHFLGRRGDVPRLLTESDIFVLSSRREGHPFVLLEAMAGGCACVATRCGGVEDTVKDRETALLAGIEDTSAMAAAVTELIRDRELRTRLGNAALEEVRARHDAKASVAALTSEYEKILGMPPPAAGSVAVDLFLRAAQELGSLGVKVAEMEERLRQVEHLAHNLRSNPIYKSARRVKRWFQPHSD